jgi:superfamily II RNA helicase
MHFPSLHSLTLQLKQGLRVTAEDYLRDNLNFGLVHAVYQWAQGTTYVLKHTLLLLTPRHSSIIPTIISCSPVASVSLFLLSVALLRSFTLSLSAVCLCLSLFSLSLSRPLCCLSLVAPSFAEICELTEVDEGTIVRCITRLDETCRDVRNCARVIGDPALFQKCQKASEIIKRDICFAASLYLS